jgi:hypothetical protein
MSVVAIFAESPVSQLRQEYEEERYLYEGQPALVQHFLEQQARLIAQAILDNAPRVRFSLPDHVFPDGAARGADTLDVPVGQREQATGRWLAFGTCDLRAQIVRQFTSLEHHLNPSISLSGHLMRFAVARTMIYQMLPEGRFVRYRLLVGDEIPSLPVEDGRTRKSALMAEKDAIVQGGDREPGRGNLQTPYSPAALRFFLPQWVAFDEKDRLLAASLQEAEAHIRSMQTFVRILHEAVAIAPCMVADETYQRKRMGILGQLVNQGRALGRHEVQEMIKRIKCRTDEGSLNRGLSLSLPYFDDQALTMKLYDMQVVPSGRVMFVPAFVVLAVRREYAGIIQDTHLNSSTRKHLLSLLAMLEKAFLTKKEYKHL